MWFTSPRLSIRAQHKRWCSQAALIGVPRGISWSVTVKSGLSREDSVATNIRGQEVANIGTRRRDGENESGRVFLPAEHRGIEEVRLVVAEGRSTDSVGGGRRRYVLRSVSASPPATRGVERDDRGVITTTGFLMRRTHA